jgi:hypothetical protein
VSNELALNEVMSLGQALADSKYFSDAKEASQAVVKVLAGQELGVGPIAAMSGLYIVKGKVTIGGSIMASLIKSSTKYDYNIVDHSNQVCIIEFFENGESVGVSEFSMDDAKQAKLHNKDNYTAFPKNMLFNRALSNGAKWYCPDLFNGQSVYTQGEIKIEGEPFSEEEPFFEPEPDLIIDNPTTEEPPAVDNVARQKWIDDIMAIEGFPKDGNPANKAAFINAQIKIKELNIDPVTVPEILAWG